MTLGAALLYPLVAPADNSTSAPEEQICDPIADYYLGMEDYPTAVKLHLAVIRRHPDLALAYYHLGFAYGELGDHKRELVDAFRLATLLAPTRYETHYNLGLVYERLGALAKAEQEILLSLRLQPDQLEARNTLGVIYAEEGNYVRARQEWAELSDAYPDYTPARANLEILKRVERGEVDKSSQLSGLAKAP